MRAGFNLELIELGPGGSPTAESEAGTLASSRPV